MMQGEIVVGSHEAPQKGRSKFTKITMKNLNEPHVLDFYAEVEALFDQYGIGEDDQEIIRAGMMDMHLYQLKRKEGLFYDTAESLGLVTGHDRCIPKEENEEDE